MESSSGEIFPGPVISSRALHTISKSDFLTTYAYKSAKDPYNPEVNPEGIINMGTAVNRLMEEELQSRLRKSDVFQYGPEFQHYYELSGTQQLRTAIADLLHRQLCPARELDPENVVVLNGVASCLDALGHALCDPGDVLITPTPVYSRIFTDFCERACVDVQPLDTTDETDIGGKSFVLKPEALEERIRELVLDGKKVKGVILVHPQNPLGEFYSKDLLEGILQVCDRHHLHLIVDEIYALSVFKNEDQFVSSLALQSAANHRRLHFVWGLTKDFGLAGFRVGVIYSADQDVVHCLKRIGTYQCTPSIIHQAAATILNDIEWCDNFFVPTNRRKLKEAYQMARLRLQNMGVEVREASSAFFLWVNAKSFLSDVTKEGELELFKDFFNAGVYVVPGSQLCCVNPGWFRMIFSVHPLDLDHGLEKIKSVLEKRKKAKILQEGEPST